jgi:hypothetical protein
MSGLRWVTAVACLAAFASLAAAATAGPKAVLEGKVHGSPDSSVRLTTSGAQPGDRATFKASDLAVTCETAIGRTSGVADFGRLSVRMRKGGRFHRTKVTVGADQIMTRYMSVSGRLKHGGREAVGTLTLLVNPPDPSGPDIEPECSTGRVTRWSAG